MLYFKMFCVFNGNFYAQSYSPGTSENTALYSHHLVVNIRLMNCVFKRVSFGVSLFGKYFLGFSFSGKVFFGFFRNIQLR